MRSSLALLLLLNNVSALRISTTLTEEKKQRLLCVLMAKSPDDPHTAWYASMLEDQCDGVRVFLGGKEDSSKPLDGKVVLAMGNEEESHENIWAKSSRMWLWLAKNEQCTEAGIPDAKGFDWILKVDTDTLIIPSNFRRMVEQEAGLSNAEFIGHAMGDPEMYAPAGAAYAVKCKALQRSTPALASLLPGADRSVVKTAKSWEARYCSPEKTIAEEVKLAHCLAIHEVKLAGAEDPAYREYVQPFQLCSHLRGMPYLEDPVKRQQDWFWMNKKNASLENCCAEYPVAFHRYHSDELKKFEVFMRSSKPVSLQELTAVHEC